MPHPGAVVPAIRALAQGAASIPFLRKIKAAYDLAAASGYADWIPKRPEWQDVDFSQPKYITWKKTQSRTSSSRRSMPKSYSKGKAGRRKRAYRDNNKKKFVNSAPRAKRKPKAPTGGNAVDRAQNRAIKRIEKILDSLNPRKVHFWYISGTTIRDVKGTTGQFSALRTPLTPVPYKPQHGAVAQGEVLGPKHHYK